MTCIPFPRTPVRAIRVEPFNRDRTHWQASYAGDQWTNAKDFQPVLPLRELIKALQHPYHYFGLPIVIVDTFASEVAA